MLGLCFCGNRANRNKPPQHCSHISSLPSECKIQVVRYLLARDAASMRLTSKLWGVIATGGLFNVVDDNDGFWVNGWERGWAMRNFNAKARPKISSGILSIRPQYDDMKRLENITSRPWLAKHIKEVIIHLDDINWEKLNRWLSWSTM